MRLLHVGSGFRPWRRGGLVAYVEDLIAEQVRRGHEVAYFFSGRQYPVPSGPRLRRWEREGVPMLEVVNSPIYDHGRQPQLEVSEPRTERLFAEALDELRPEVVHVHELAGLPSSLLDLIREADVPVVVTLQDYFPLCPSFRLVDSSGRICLRREIGADCVATTAADSRDPGLLFEATTRLALVRTPSLSDDWGRRAVKFSGRLGPATRRRRGRADATAFQRRRDLNVERLSRADRLIAMSTRVAEIYEQLGVDPARMRTMQLTLAHLERLRPRPEPHGAPLTFATLAAFESSLKGANLVLDAVRELERAGHRFRLLVYGHVEPHLGELARAHPSIEVRGRYEPEALDHILDEVDVGLMPSVWEEAYGYAGIEFLAKGIPVIANAIGGMTDYARDGETGWLNRSCSAPELTRIMAGLVAEPGEVAAMHARVVAARDSIVKPMKRHADEMESLYRETLA